LFIFLVLLLVSSCAHVSRKDDPETRPMPEAPFPMAETAPAPESAPESLSSSERAALAGVLARSVRERVATMLAALPSRGKNICGTPAFEALGTTLSTNFREIKTAILSLEALLLDAGKDVPADEFAALKAATEKVMPLCPDEDTICASSESELECYDAVKPHLAAVRAYAYALAGLLK
jgi:hypothetical protein